MATSGDRTAGAVGAAPREWSACTRVCSAVWGRAGWTGSLWGSPPALTAVDAEPLHLALGSEAGHVFWYEREKDRLRRLRTENSRSAINCVKIVSTVDYMVAAGNKIGHITIFQVPKTHPDSVPDYVKPKNNQQIERYTISDLHKTEITALEWSKNGMKLFSGDKNGIVVLTEIDFYMHICKSIEIINESYEIIQLSYFQNHLLISSTFRSIICSKQNAKWNVDQVGKKDRKSLCKLGGTFHFNYDKPNDVHIYTARPGLRIWTSDFQGNVLETLLFKDAITNPVDRVQLLNPASKKKTISIKDINFGPLLVFNDKYIVSYTDDLLYIVDPISLLAIAVVDEFRRIISVAVNKQEIFVLEGENSIVRLSYIPDIEVINVEENKMTKSLINPIQAAINTIKDIANSETKLFFSDVTEQCETFFHNVQDPAIPTYTDITSIVKAEECFELPPVRELVVDIDNTTVEKLMSNMCVTNDSCKKNNNQTKRTNIKSHANSNKLHIFDSIGQTEFSDDILHSSKKSKKIVNNHVNTNKNSCTLNESKNNMESSKSPKMTKPSLMTMSFCYDHNLLPDDRSPESIEKEIRDKEEKLAKVLNLEPITIRPSKLESQVDDVDNDKNILFEDDSVQKSEKNSNDHENQKSNEKQNISHLKVSRRNNKVQEKIEIPADFTPKCVSIPNIWNLQEIKINQSSIENNEKPVENSVDCDADWEFL